jgi:hypothetical protein
MTSQPYAIGLIGPPLPVKPSESLDSGGFAFSSVGSGVGNLWGLFSQAGKKARRYFAITNLERVPVSISSSPASVVPGGDAHVRMTQLLTDVAKLDPSCEQLGRERVSEIFLAVVWKAPLELPLPMPFPPPVTGVVTR